MRRQLRSRAIKKTKIRTPGGRLAIHFRRKRPNYHQCAACGGKLNSLRLRAIKAKRLPKTEKRPERPFPNLCSKCMRKKIKERVRQ